MANISKIKVGNTSYGITATPTAHASTATTYGAASASNYGHVKLSDNYKSSAGTAASGIGASSAAVYNAYNTLNSNLFCNMEWKVLMRENVTTETTFNIPDVREYKFLALILMFGEWAVAEQIVPSSWYSRLRTISGYVDGESFLTIGRCAINSPTTIKAYVVKQVNTNSIYITLVGIK